MRSNANPQLEWWLAAVGIQNRLVRHEFAALCSAGAGALPAASEVFILQIDNWTMTYQPIALFRLVNRLLRDRLSLVLERDRAQLHAAAGAAPGRCIWSSRADTAARHIRNEDAPIGAVRSACVAAGLAVTVFGAEASGAPKPSALTVIAAFAEAALIAGPHGGRLLHVVCALPGAAFIEFVFVQLVNDFAHIALSLRLRYWQVPVDGTHFSNASLSAESADRFAALVRCVVVGGLARCAQEEPPHAVDVPAASADGG